MLQRGKQEAEEVKVDWEMGEFRATLKYNLIETTKEFRTGLHFSAGE